MERKTVEITIERLQELIKKEMAFDLYRKQVMGNKYAVDLERILFDAPYTEPTAEDNDF